MGTKPGSCAGQRKAQEPPAQGRGCRGANPTPTSTSIPKPQHRAGLRTSTVVAAPRRFSPLFLQQNPPQLPWLHRTLSKPCSGPNQTWQSLPNPSAGSQGQFSSGTAGREVRKNRGVTPMTTQTPLRHHQGSSSLYSHPPCPSSSSCYTSAPFQVATSLQADRASKLL